MILVESDYAATENPEPVALDLAATNGAEPALRRLVNPEPHRLLTIFKERAKHDSGNLPILRELAVLPTDKAPQRANPQSAVMRHQQGDDKIAGELFTMRRLPGNSTNTVETKQAELRAQPEIAVGRLSNGVDPAPGEAFANLPCRVRVLADVERWV